MVSEEIMSGTSTGGGKTAKIMMFGLDGAGKTTILHTLTQKGDVGCRRVTNPTTGFNVESVVHKDITFTVWDMAGREQYRHVWIHYIQDTYAIVFVVDANERGRIPMAKEALKELLEYEELKSALLLILANKQDLLHPLNEKELVEQMELNYITNRSWYLNPTSAIYGDGLQEGLDWLCTWL